MQIGFRAAQIEDFTFCRSLYFAKSETVTPDQDASFRERWDAMEVRIIVCNGADVGWLQSRVQDDALFLVQVFLRTDHQGKGIGTETLRRLMAEAARSGLPLTLGVVKTNPALRLYERLGFRITHEDDRKFYMKLELIQGPGQL